METVTPEKKGPCWANDLFYDGGKQGVIKQLGL